MAKLGDLIVKIGADTRDLNKSLGKVRRNMRSMTSNFKSLGQDLSRSVSLPLLAIGGAALKGAADLEKLEASFVSLTGGTQQAADMMQQLNEFTAKTPFQIEAVANSARQLIASGTKVSEVNDQLQFLGDIAATSGVEINEIAAIFAKVNAKGKVELENLNQLAERGIPIFKALADATGLPADKLGAGAVSVDEFNNALKDFTKEGGFAEGAMERLSETAAGKFSTALDNLKIAGAELTESLMPVLKDALDGVVRLAQKFTALDDSTKKTILVVAGLAAALGPLLIVFSSVVTAVQTIGPLMAGLSGPFGIAALAIGGVIAAVKGYQAITSKTETANSKLVKTIGDIEAATIKQTSEARALVKLYGKEKTSLEDRERILNRLKEIDTDHFKNLEAEKTTLEQLNTQLTSYIANVKAAAIEKQLQAEAESVYNEAAQAELALFDAQVRLEEEKRKLAEKGITYREGVVNRDVDAYRAALNEVTKYTEAVETSSDKITEFENRRTQVLQQFEETIADATAATDANSTTTDTATTATREYLGVLTLLPAALIQTDEATKGLVKTTGTVADLITDDMRAAAQAFDSFADSVTTSMENAAASMLSGVVEMIGHAAGMQKPLEGVGMFVLETFANLAIELGELAIGYGVAIEGIKAALTSLQGPLAVAAGIALVGLGAALKGAVAKSVEDAGMPALANGGLAYGPTTAIVGDNRNARIDPEVIAPLSKLQDIMGGNNIQVYGRISGDDILLSNTRASRDRNRYA